jgi:hypothetical protein
MPEFQIARLTDGVDPERGPYFSEDHARVEDGEEKERILSFLTSGRVIRRAAGRSPDFFASEAGRVVPIVTYTDGSWIWSAGQGYYLRKYDLSVDVAFYEHIRRQNYEVGTIDDTTAQAAAEFFQNSQRRGPNWQPPTNVDGAESS